MSHRFPPHYPITWPFYFLFPVVGDSATIPSLPRSAHIGERPKQEIRLLFFGDLMPMKGEAVPIVDEPIRDIVRSADLVLGNCESPVVDPTGRSANHRLVRHWMGAGFVREFLENMGIVPERLILSVANNHIADQGPQGLDSTLQALRAMGVTPVGHRIRNSSPITIIRCRGTRIGVAAWTQWLNHDALDRDHRVWLHDDIARLRRRDLRENDLRGGNAIDTLIGLPHWDYEFRHTPRPWTRKAARALIGNGFDLLAGCHPHVIQPAERLGAGLVLYSLGSLNGPSFPFLRWPLRLSCLLEIFLSGDDIDRGRITGHTIHPVAQCREGTRVLLRHSEQVEPRMRESMERRLARIFPDRG